MAEEEVQSAINASQSFLPSDLPAPPIYSKTNPADAPVLTLAITSKTMPLSQVEDLVDTRLAPKISQLNGVGLVSISGGQKPAVRIQVNPARCSPTASIWKRCAPHWLRPASTRPKVTSTVRARTTRSTPTISSSPAAITKTWSWPIATARPVFLHDVAKVVNGVENTKQAAWMNQTPAVILNVQRQPGANTISVVKAIKLLLPQLQANLPSGIQVTTLTDLTTGIKASVADVEFELMLAIGLVVMVIFVFLRNVYATIIPSVAVPLSLVGTFGVMYALGYSLDNLSLMALTISTGFVVDDAIVMIENISRYIEEGMSPMEAALKGAEQIGFTILSLTVSLIAVLIPLLFMGDVVGRLFREFAVTLAVTIVISAVVSLTLTPMMCSRILRHNPNEKQGKFYQASERVFERMIAFYGRTLSRRAALPDAHAAGGAGHAGADHHSVHRHPQGLFPGAGHRRDPGHLAGARLGLVCRHGQGPAGTGQDHPPGSGGREPLLVHRRGRHQHHAQQRPHVDQPQAARATRSERRGRDPPAEQLAVGGLAASSCTCSRCRTSPSMTASAARNTSTRSKTPMPPN